MKPSFKKKPINRPKWLRRRMPTGQVFENVRTVISANRLHTVCQEANCPNQFECFAQRTATFLILGDRCTRNCHFCKVDVGSAAPPDPKEPGNVAIAACELKLQYVVVTSVTRDDLLDGGAAHFAATIEKVRQRIPGGIIEVLIPDFKGRHSALETVLAARPDVLNHNIETVPRLYLSVRPQADYLRSLQLIRRSKKSNYKVALKSGMMLGLGEKNAEVRQTLYDLLGAGCRLLTLGQYLQPTKQHLPVKRFVTPKEFDDWRQVALKMGFGEVASGPFVRSSYHARELLDSFYSREKRSTVVI